MIGHNDNKNLRRERIAVSSVIVALRLVFVEFSLIAAENMIIADTDTSIGILEVNAAGLLILVRKILVEFVDPHDFAVLQLLIVGNGIGNGLLAITLGRMRDDEAFVQKPGSLHDDRGNAVAAECPILQHRSEAHHQLHIFTAVHLSDALRVNVLGGGNHFSSKVDFFSLFRFGFVAEISLSSPVEAIAVFDANISGAGIAGCIGGFEVYNHIGLIAFVEMLNDLSGRRGQRPEVRSGLARYGVGFGVHPVTSNIRNNS